MKKIILCLLLAAFSNVIFASFPVNNIANQEEIVLISENIEAPAYAEEKKFGATCLFIYRY
tara:strand:- start:169 stop:351 length:183 start_codon:yes stop_codon:yes gene_type:complete